MYPLVTGSILANLLVFAIGAFLLVVGFRAYRFGRVVRDTPTAKPGSVAAGRAEVEGTVRPLDGPIEAPFTGEACVCLDWTLEERVPDGGWVEHAAGTRIEPFYLEGESGRVLVRADKHPTIEELPWEYDSRVFTASESDEVEQFLAAHRASGGENSAATIDPSAREDPSKREDPSTRANPATTRQPGAGESGLDSEEERWRFVKRLIVPGTDLYVFGSLEPQHDYGDVGFVPDGTTDRFVINRTSEEWTAAAQYWLGLLAVSAGLLFLLWGGAIATGLASESLL